MSIRRAIQTGLMLFSMLFAELLSAAELHVTANALFENRAFLTINGRSQVLKSGQTSPEGVKLVSANAREAVVEINGKFQRITLSSEINAGFEAVERKRVSLTRNNRSEYVAGGSINGYRIEMKVDTGANVVAMSSKHASQIGLQYKRDGKRSRVTTASGEVQAWSVMLDRVEVGGLLVHNVRASVIEGDYPTDVLLGMSWLNHVEMREQDGILYLEQ